jgi:methylmalonyl-CoA/ethylmalonyl-CoA epimerase
MPRGGEAQTTARLPPFRALSENGAMLSTIGQIGSTVVDLPQAVAFYRDKLGLTHLFDAGTMAFFDCGGVRLMLSTGEKPPDRYNSILYFRVDDIQATHARLSGSAVRFDREPHLIARMPDHELWMAFFRDPEGNVLALMSEVR